MNGLYNYHADGIRLVTVENPVPVVGLRAYPSSLADVCGDSPRHSGLQAVVALAKCLAEIYSSRVEGRDADFSECIDAEPFAWQSNAWERRLLFVWQCAYGSLNADIGPNLYTLIKDCSAGRAIALSERP